MVQHQNFSLSKLLWEPQTNMLCGIGLSYPPKAEQRHVLLAQIGLIYLGMNLSSRRKLSNGTTLISAFLLAQNEYRPGNRIAKMHKTI